MIPREPLAGRNQFEGTVAFVKDAHRVCDILPRAVEHPVGGFGDLDNLLLSLGDGKACELPVDGVGCVRIGAFPARFAEGHRNQASIPAYDLTERELVFAPPFDVGLVAEGAYHDNPRALLGVRLRVGHDRYGRVKQRSDRLLPEKRLVPFIVGVGQHGHAGREQFRPRCRDHDVSRRSPSCTPKRR